MSADRRLNDYLLFPPESGVVDGNPNAPKEYDSRKDILITPKTRFIYDSNDYGPNTGATFLRYGVSRNGKLTAVYDRDGDELKERHSSKPFYGIQARDMNGDPLYFAFRVEKEGPADWLVLSTDKVNDENLFTLGHYKELGTVFLTEQELIALNVPPKVE